MLIDYLITSTYHNIFEYQIKQVIGHILFFKGCLMHLMLNAG